MPSKLLNGDTWLDSALDFPNLILAPQVPARDAIAQMNRTRSSFALIVEGEKITGIFTERDAVKLAANHFNLEDKLIWQVMTRNVTVLARDRLDNLFQAINLMRLSSIRHLPVVDAEGKLLGILTPERLRSVLHPTDLLKIRRVADVTTSAVLTAPVTASVLEVAELMFCARKSCVVLTAWPSPEPSAIVPMGILTERDFVRFQATGLDFARTPCKVVMSAPLQPISLDATLWDAHEKMQKQGIRRLVAVNAAGFLAGIVTQTSILQALDPVELCLTVSQLQDEIVKQTQQLQQSNQELHRELGRRQEAEQQLRELNQRLEERSEQQMLQLISREKMAALGELMACLTHDLSGPIAALRSSIANLGEFLEPETLKPWLTAFEGLPLALRAEFWQMTEQSQQRVRRSRREMLQLEAMVARELTAGDRDRTAELSEALVNLGIEGELEQYSQLLARPDSLQILERIEQWVSLQKNLQLAHTAAAQTAEAIVALKKYARQDFVETKVKANVVDGIDTVLTLYQGVFKQGVEVFKSCEESLPEILCYPSELNQVWMNLIQNSLHAMSNQGLLNIDVKVEGGFLRVAIQDSGPGIPPEIKADIFQPFFSTKPLGEGGGLGLNIVSKIVEKHQGRITLESVPGQTTFAVYLPLEV